MASAHRFARARQPRRQPDDSDDRALNSLADADDSPLDNPADPADSPLDSPADSPTAPTTARSTASPTTRQHRPRGGKPVDLRQVVDGIRWVLHTQAHWSDIPASYASSAHKRFQGGISRTGEVRGGSRIHRERRMGETQVAA